VCAGKVLFQNPKRAHAYNLCLKRKKAEKESFAEPERSFLPRKLLASELKLSLKRGAFCKGLATMYDLFVRLFVLGDPCFYGFFDGL
jgi:hypothetical protein